jgi:hypothetical protein
MAKITERHRRAVLQVQKKHKLSNAEWCRRAGGINPNTLSNFKKGRANSLNLHTIVLLAEAIGESVDALILGLEGTDRHPNGNPSLYPRSRGGDFENLNGPMPNVSKMDNIDVELKVGANTVITGTAPAGDVGRFVRAILDSSKVSAI